MRKNLLVLATVALFASSLCHASGAIACDGKLVGSLRGSERIVESLRPDKASRMRVFSSDGSVFTAGQALWMGGQLRLVEKACTDNDAANAARLLAAVQEPVKEHRQTSS